MILIAHTQQPQQFNIQSTVHIYDKPNEEAQTVWWEQHFWIVVSWYLKCWSSVYGWNVSILYLHFNDLYWYLWWTVVTFWLQVFMLSLFRYNILQLQSCASVSASAIQKLASLATTHNKKRQKQQPRMRNLILSSPAVTNHTYCPLLLTVAECN